MFALHSLCFKKMFLPLKEPLVVTLSETCALTSRTYVVEQSMTILNLLEVLRLLWSHSSIFDLEKKLKNAIFLVFFSQRKTFSGNCHLSFSEIFKTNCQEDIKLLIFSNI